VGNDQFPHGQNQNSTVSIETSTSEVKPNPETIRQSLRDFFGACPPDLRMYVWVLDGKRSHWFRIKDLDKAARFAASVPGSCYFGVALSAEDLGPYNRCKSDQAAGLIGLWSDIDIKGPAHKEPNLPVSMEEAFELANSLGVFPSYHIDSGHGLQAWWMFDRPWIFADDADRQKAQELARR
jgi:hypothetical protein